ncbi:hypothetical protein ACFY20_40005 [Streptomyces sp. NPDC001312]|uniref:hypothetical protein n=1 Tax=Streptomyces sp. NPDC001312 TaxID=3364561 RepID=UPI0036BCF5AF
MTVPADVRVFYLVRNGTGPASDFGWPTSRDAREPTGYFLPEGEGVGPLENLGAWFEGPVATALWEGRGFGDDNAPRVIDGRLDWQ